MKHVRDNKIRVIKKYGFGIYLLERSGSLPRRGSAEFEKSLKTFDIVFMPYVKNFLSIALKFGTTVFLGMPRDFGVFNNSFVFPTFSGSFSSKNACFLLRLTFSHFI